MGKDVTRFKVGDSVFGESNMKMQWRNGGTLAEHAAVPEGALQLKPDNVSVEQAASVPSSGYIALINLKGSAELKPRKLGRTWREPDLRRSFIRSMILLLATFAG